MPVTINIMVTGKNMENMSYNEKLQDIKNKYNTYCDNNDLAEKILKSTPSITGLYPHEIIVLMIIKTWKIKVYDNDIKEELIKYGVKETLIKNPLGALKALIKRGYIKKGDGYSSLDILTKKELDLMLKSRKLEVGLHRLNSIELVKKYFTPKEIDQIFPHKNIYVLTDLGKKEVECNPEISPQQSSACWIKYNGNNKEKDYLIERINSRPSCEFLERAEIIKRKLLNYPKALNNFDAFINEIWSHYNDCDERLCLYDKYLEKMIEAENLWKCDQVPDEVIFRMPKEYNKRYYLASQLSSECLYITEENFFYVLHINPLDYHMMCMLIYLYKNTNAVRPIPEPEDVDKLIHYLNSHYIEYYMHSIEHEVFNTIEKNPGSYSISIISDMYPLRYECTEISLRREKDSLYEQVKDKCVNIIKWSNEYRLYSFVSEMVPSTTFQYRCKWLQGQSIDVFLEDYGIGIEYQGIQHYEQTNYFGDYIQNLERDRRKKELCKINNVQLLEWKYDTEVNGENVLMFLLQNGVTVSLKEHDAQHIENIKMFPVI